MGQRHIDATTSYSRFFPESLLRQILIEWLEKDGGKLPEVDDKWYLSWRPYEICREGREVGLRFFGSKTAEGIREKSPEGAEGKS